MQLDPGLIALGCSACSLHTMHTTENGPLYRMASNSCAYFPPANQAERVIILRNFREMVSQCISLIKQVRTRCSPANLMNCF